MKPEVRPIVGRVAFGESDLRATAQDTLSSCVQVVMGLPQALYATLRVVPSDLVEPEQQAIIGPVGVVCPLGEEHFLAFVHDAAALPSGIQKVPRQANTLETHKAVLLQHPKLRPVTLRRVALGEPHLEATIGGLLRRVQIMGRQTHAFNDHDTVLLVPVGDPLRQELPRIGRVVHLVVFTGHFVQLECRLISEEQGDPYKAEDGSLQEESVDGIPKAGDTRANAATQPCGGAREALPPRGALRGRVVQHPARCPNTDQGLCDAHPKLRGEHTKLRHPCHTLLLVVPEQEAAEGLPKESNHEQGLRFVLAQEKAPQESRRHLAEFVH
mmetsp:Transcript_11682/g.31432  ORF Transcript_11682/g.31432 Transcript_11682/m.31432 type:complete len:327 (-) Transcript_11682:270-1250(-)